jgi:hypothetical protein
VDVELTYDAENNEYCVFRGCDLILRTHSYDQAIKRFNMLCDQTRTACA